MQRGRSAVTLKQLLEAGLIQPGQELRFRGDATKSAVLSDDGKINLDGKSFTSLSTAASAFTGGTSTNGWLAWQTRLGEKWVTLSDVRQQLTPAQA
jgi:hypothetical protein